MTNGYVFHVENPATADTYKPDVIAESSPL